MTPPVLSAVVAAYFSLILTFCPENALGGVSYDPTENKVMKMADDLLVDSFSAGSSYSEVWIRDGMTFLDVAMEVNSKAYIKGALLPFFTLQAASGEVPDGYINNTAALNSYPDKLVGDWPWCQGTNIVCKNNVETDQETSLVQAIKTYVKKADDTDFLGIVVKGVSVIDRLELALDFLLKERYDPDTGLITGATTVDWGDIQPEDSPGTVMTNLTHRSIDIYDNAMFVLAVDAYIDMCKLVTKEYSKWSTLADSHRARTKKVLWDDKNQKFIPHVYLKEGSPFDKSLDENQIYYHSGTAVAALANILTVEEVKGAYEKMKANVQAVASQGGKITVGMTVYPPYPKGAFKNAAVAIEYSYQNAGDWDWFGGRMVQALIQYGLLTEAREALQPMIDRVIECDGFFEWFDFHGKPSGSAKFHGSAGALGKAIRMLQSHEDPKRQKSLRALE